MKKIVSSLGIAVILAAAAPLWADVYTFTPNTPDLGDLPHQSFFQWGIKWNLPTGEVITKAQLTYKNIYDWAVEPDALYTHLLDSVADPNGAYSPNYQSVGSGDQKYERITVVGADNQGGGDNFANMPNQVLLGKWSDPFGGSPRNFDLTYDLTGYLGMLADGSFGFGIDPDCHYYNSGIVLTIETGTNTPTNPAVPAPTGGFLAAVGLALLAWRLVARQA